MSDTGGDQAHPSSFAVELVNALEPGPPAIPTGRFSTATVPLHGGLPCLDFTYSAVWRATPQPDETLVNYRSLVDLIRRTGELDDRAADALVNAADDDPGCGKEVVQRGIALREAIYRLVLAHIADRPPRREDLAILNPELQEAMAAAAIHPDEGGYAWDWNGSEDEPPSLALPLWLVARSAAELMASPNLARVKRCPGDGCGWLFLDTSKNQGRRWCSMAGCGNRARVRAFAARQRTTSRPKRDA